MANESTYLRRLRFNPQLLKTGIASYLTRLRLILLITSVVVVLGAVSFAALPRVLIPDIKIPLVIVSTVLPGAGPADVESLITVPLEDSIRSVANISTLDSTSQNSVSIITVQFNSGVDPDKAQSDVKTAVDSVTGLPSDAQPPSVAKLDFQNLPVWSYQLGGGDNPANLFRLSQNLKKQLEAVTNVDRVAVSGDEEQEVQMLLRSDALAKYQINPLQIIPLVSSALKSLPAGSVQSHSSSLLLTVDPAVTDVNDLRTLRLNLNGSVVALGDIFTITYRSKSDQPKAYVRTADGSNTRSVSFDVYRTSGAKITDVVDAVRTELSNRLAAYGRQFTVYSVSDVGDQINTQFADLQRDFTLTIFLVSVILFVFLGLRQALVASLTTPLVFLITFIVMSSLGVSLSFISVFSLLLSLGLLVDDTIVIISALTAYYRTRKFNPLQAGLLVWQDFLIPVLTTTTTTVWAFLPLLISGGIIGEFIKPIPIVVTTTLIASILVALFITFPLTIYLLRPHLPRRLLIFLGIISTLLTVTIVVSISPKNFALFIPLAALAAFFFVFAQVRTVLFGHLNTQAKRLPNWLFNGLISFQPLASGYKNIILNILHSEQARRRAVIMVIVFSLFSFMLMPLGLVKNEFFPATDQNVISVSVELPSGTSVSATNDELVNLLAQFPKYPEINFISGVAGQGAGTGYTSGSSGVNLISYSVELVDKKLRHVPSSVIADNLRAYFQNYQKGRLTVSESSSGPPVGSDLQIKLFGSDLGTLDKLANQLEDYLGRQPGVINVDKSIKPGASQLVFAPDYQKLASLGIGEDTIGFWLRFYASGITADKIKLDPTSSLKEEINLRLSDTTPQAQDFSRFIIPTAQGNLPITSLGTVSLTTSPTLITREGGKRTLSVTAGVKPGVSVTTENAALEKYANSLVLPDGYSWTTGGANEQNQKSVQSVLQAMVLSVILIIATMVIQFNSFRRALIVILVIPLSISGVFVLFGLTQTALTFPALIGVLALFGIVVKNSILVVDKIEANLRAGLTYVEAIADGASSRLEPIALTSICAIFGLIPITLSDPLWRGLGGAIIAGLTFSGITMLFFIPVVYFYLFRPSTKPPATPRHRR